MLSIREWIGQSQKRELLILEIILKNVHRMFLNQERH
jgi:hypothetical protein